MKDQLELVLTLLDQTRNILAEIMDLDETDTLLDSIGNIDTYIKEAVCLTVDEIAKLN